MLIDMFKHLVTSTAVTNRIFLSEKTFFFMRAQHVMSYHIIYKYHGQNERLSSDIKKYIFFAIYCSAKSIKIYKNNEGTCLLFTSYQHLNTFFNNRLIFLSILLLSFHPECNGGGAYWAMQGKNNEKCQCSHHNKTGLIEIISLFDTASIMTNTLG